MALEWMATRSKFMEKAHAGVRGMERGGLKARRTQRLSELGSFYIIFVLQAQ
jgi:hypothetical protein